MLRYFILLLPCFICFGYTLQMAMRRHKTPLHRVIIGLLASLGIYFLCYSYKCTPDSSQSALSIADIVQEWITPLTIPLAVAIINGLKRQKMFDKWFWIFTVPVFLLGFSSLNFDVVMGVVMLCFVLHTFLQIGGRELSLSRFVAFFTHNSASRPLMVIGFSFIIFILFLVERLFIGPSSFHGDFTFGAVRLLITSAVLLLMCNALYQADSPWITLKSIFDITSINSQSPDEEEMTDTEVQTEAVFEPLPSEIPTMTEAQSAVILQRIDSLAIAFKQYMVAEQAYLQSDISIEKVSEHLGSNRFYISKLVNVEHGMSFRDYVNTMRIDYAKSYMKQYPNATQEQIAMTCGFSSASYFNRKFKQITGHSPQDWKTR